MTTHSPDTSLSHTEMAGPVVQRSRGVQGGVSLGLVPPVSTCSWLRASPRMKKIKHTVVALGLSVTDARASQA